ncbi:DUF4010 domain-containing protein [Hydrogenophaga sp. R2]|uniref:DUF4010 domain-containing protein n=1 Tax=Hydrogenophaga sp. R2 TaxID=3132827 RepID=UPI003CF15FF7
MTSPLDPDLLRAATVLSAALGCGLLVGIERERRKGHGPTRALAGLRTFTLTCVMGAAAALSGMTGLVVVGAAFVAALGVVAYARDRSDDPGVTTEVALLLTYLIGVLCTWRLLPAAALAVGLTALLAARERLHGFALHWLRPAEVRDGILLAALLLVVLPLLPDQPLLDGALNPQRLGQLLSLLLLVQSGAHLARRLLQARHAVVLSSLASGLASSTATIATLGLSAREPGAVPRVLAGGGLLSCVATQAQMVMVAAAVMPAWLPYVGLSAVVAAGLALAAGLWLVHGAAEPGPAEGPLATPRIEGLAASASDRMFSLRGALAVAALLAGVQLVVHLLQRWLGDAGLLAGVVLGSLADLHAALAAVFSGGPPAPVAERAVVLALLVHAGSKTVTALVSGGWAYARWLAPGLWLHTLVGVAVLLV